MYSSALTDAYQTFMQTAQPFVVINNDADYDATMAELQCILEAATDTLDDPLNPLIDMMVNAIEKYETNDPLLKAFFDETESMPTD